MGCFIVPNATFRVVYVFLVLRDERRLVVDGIYGDEVRSRLAGLNAEEVIATPRSHRQSHVGRRLKFLYRTPPDDNHLPAA